MELQPGHEVVVRVPVATLWSSPDEVRPVDRDALAAEPDVPGWERIARAMEDAWIASAAGLKAPQEALDEAASRVQEELAAGR